MIASEFPEGTDSSNSGNKNAPNIEVIGVTENDPIYKEEGWTNRTVADVKDDQDTIFIYINESNLHFTKLLERAQQYSNQAVESIKNRYKEHIGFCAFMISRNKIEEKLQAEGKSIAVEDIEAIKNADLENSCETICGMISDFFDYIRTETEEI